MNKPQFYLPTSPSEGHTPVPEGFIPYPLKELEALQRSLSKMWMRTEIQEIGKNYKIPKKEDILI